MFLSGSAKFDVALAPSSYNGAQTSSYYDMAKYDKVIFVASGGSMSSTDSITMSILQGKSCTGSGSVALGVYSTMNGTAAATGQVTKATMVTVNGTSEDIGVEAGTMVINGLTFTFKSSSAGTIVTTTGTFNANRYVWASSGGGIPYTTLHHLAAYINNATYGVPGVIAIVGSASTNMTLEANDAHNAPDKAITILVSKGASCVYINKMVGSVECQSAELATSSDFNYVACQISASATMKHGAVAIRSGARFSPDTTALMSYDFGV